MAKFILDNYGKINHAGPPFDKWLGYGICNSPFEAEVSIDFTAAPGATLSVFYSLVWMFDKWEYQKVVKADEWVDVSPVHQQYYQLTHKQKEELETRIKQGLQSSAQAVADLELLLHDKRKYEEFLRYLGYRTPREMEEAQKKKPPESVPATYDELYLTVDNDEKKKKHRITNIDNHSLKAVFIDQVDAHTGEVAMRSIIQRWPTLISDFMRMKDEDVNPETVMKDLDVSRAEAVVLITKNKLFNEWKKLFAGQTKQRYERIMALVRSRKKSVDEYKEWLTPVVARHRMIKEQLSSDAGRSEQLAMYFRSGGTAVSMSMIEDWAWKDFRTPEFFKGGSELEARIAPGAKMETGELDPYDEWTKKTLIWDKEQGLVADHNWITEEWIQKQKEDMFKENWLTRKLYYSFIKLVYVRTVVRMPNGEEIEDGIFNVKLTCMSRNVLFAKILQLKAKQEELNQYVADLIGTKHEADWMKGKKYEVPKAKFENIQKLFDKLSLNFQIFKRGPYEHDFDERLTKYYFAPMAEERYNPIVNLIKKKMGYGLSS
ncbi:hypothetical protein HZB03_04805 [Candidatus Woesearchaeota archaeon]|nr:hypothetical protein [Candidatus Woesearchaeota archaeon]